MVLTLVTGDWAGQRKVVLVNAVVNLLTVLYHFLFMSYQSTHNDIR